MGAPAQLPIFTLGGICCKNCSREDFARTTPQYLNCGRGSFPPTTTSRRSPFRTRFPKPLAEKVNCSRSRVAPPWRLHIYPNVPDGALPWEEPDGAAGLMDANFASERSPSAAARNAAHCVHSADAFRWDDSADAPHWNGSDTPGSDHFAPGDSGSDGSHSRAPCSRSTLHSSPEA